MKLKFMNPDDIMNVIIALIVLAVGMFAFFVTISNIPTTEPHANTSGRHGAGTNDATSPMENSTYKAIINASGTGNSVFNIVGVVLIIGAIMAIVGMVYSYVRPGR